MLAIIVDFHIKVTPVQDLKFLNRDKIQIHFKNVFNNNTNIYKYVQNEMKVNKL